MLLELFSEAFSTSVKLPNTTYDTKKIIDNLEFTCKIIDMCCHDYVIFKINKYFKMNVKIMMFHGR